MIRILLVLISLFSCGPIHKEKSNPSATGNVAELQLKSLEYSNLIEKNHLDSNGFILTDTCDSMLFSGLYSAALGPEINTNIRAAYRKRADGAPQWYRRPAQDCGIDGLLSKSTFSRDMLLGLLWHSWKLQDKTILIELMEDLKRNNYHLRGEGSIGELGVTPSYLNTMAWMLDAMGGPNYANEKLLPVIFIPAEDFSDHLAVWHILLRGEVLGGISPIEKAFLGDMANRENKNPLFVAANAKYTDGNYSKAISILLDESHWPEGTLPTTNNHCAEWPVQRPTSDTTDWSPCLPEAKEHTGAELVVIYRLVINSSRG